MMATADPLEGLHIIDTDTHWSEPHERIGERSGLSRSSNLAL
jgi:hypothetical protein